MLVAAGFDTAKALFFNYGIKRITIEEIWKKSKVSKVTFYKYFKDKNDLIKTIKEELVRTGFDKFDEINALPLSYPEKIEMMTVWKMQFLSSMRSEFIREIIDIDSVTEETKRRYLENIQQAQLNGEIDPSLSPELIWLVTEKLNEIVKECRWENHLSSHTEAQAQLRQIYFCGLLKR